MGLLINEDLFNKLQQGDKKILAKAITMVENEAPGYESLLKKLSPHKTNCIGITGPPGAGKSTLINALLKELCNKNYKTAVLSVDPSSPFNFGALLGDRVRMAEFFLNPLVYIRSLASRGSLGGLHPKMIEVLEVVKSADFDYVIIETVGVGQSEVEIAGIADTTVVVLVPEAGDEVQTMKAGVMEIADIFVVNKSDRPNAAEFAKNLFLLSHQKEGEWQTPVVQCVAMQSQGASQLLNEIEKHSQFSELNRAKKVLLYTEKAMQLIAKKRMADIDRLAIRQQIELAMTQNTFNLFELVAQYARI